MRGGSIRSRTLSFAGCNGNYWSSTVQSGTDARNLLFNSDGSSTQSNNYRNRGFSLRCLALYPATGDKGFTARPLFFVRGGYTHESIYALSGAGHLGVYWSSATRSAIDAYDLRFHSGNPNTQNYDYRFYGLSLRCVASGRSSRSTYSS